MAKSKTARVAAVTMLRDDLFYLKIWLAHYGEMLGRENCYIVNHGHTPEVAEMAKGCNIIGIPGHHHKNFDMKRWRLLNNIVQGLNAGGIGYGVSILSFVFITGISALELLVCAIQAYVFALESGHERATPIRQILISLGREAPEADKDC